MFNTVCHRVADVRVPVTISYREMEKVCYHDKYEGVICDDLDTTVEINPEDAELERAELETIIDEYLDDVIDIILSDERYRKALLKRLSK